MYESSLVSKSWSTVVICVHFDDSNSDLSDVVSYCVLIYIFLMISDAEYLSCACWSFLFPVWINVYSVLLHIFNWVVWGFFYVDLHELFTYDSNIT